MPRVPRPIPGCDIRKLPLRPNEAFLLSRLDAMASERDLSLITGLPVPEVASVLDRLFELGVITFIEDERGPSPGDKPRVTRSPSVTPGPDPGRSAPPMRTPRSSAPPPKSGPVMTPPLYDPAELDEDVEIEPERRRRILDLYYQLDEITHYEILGVTAESDRKQIKGAYYALAPEFHPDKYFRKRLGSYKTRIESIFNRITLAHDVLTTKPRRAEYDEYLEQMSRNKAMAMLLAETPRDVARVSAAVDEVAAAVAGVGPPVREGAPPGFAPASSVPSSLGRYSSEAAGARPGEPAPFGHPAAGSHPTEGPYEPASSRGAVDAAAEPLSERGSGVASSRSPASSRHFVEPAPESPRSRRETLARKLSGGVLRRSALPSHAPAHDSARAERAAEALRRRYEAALVEARRVQLQRYLDLGKSALERKDYGGAANAYRIAAALAPEDREVQTTCEAAMRLAASALAEGYLKQAKYEENQGRWAEAALSYAKACSGRPTDARAHERVAFATLKSSANTRRAVEFARKAVELDPTVIDYRLTLARAYAAAGFEMSAQGEIARAQTLAPNDPKIREFSAFWREQAQKNAKPG